jgi:hypothetical protein
LQPVLIERILIAKLIEVTFQQSGWLTIDPHETVGILRRREEVVFFLANKQGNSLN